MSEVERAAEIRGKTMSWTWTEGPTKGKTHVHVFHEDGTVEWRDAEASPSGGPAKERPEYAAFQVADGVYLVSYLAPSGFTLTVALNFQNSKIVGIASSAKDWHPIQGTFEVAKEG